MPPKTHQFVGQSLRLSGVSPHHRFDIPTDDEYPYGEKHAADQPDGSRIGDVPSQPRRRSRLSSGIIRGLISDPTKIRHKRQSNGRDNQTEYDTQHG